MNIDLNSDLGEGFGLWKMGDDEELMKIVSSANIACGGHAGDYSTMHNAIASATKENVVIGAHPGFEDRQGFGRRRIALTTAEISQLVAGQVGALMGIAATNGAKVSYVKPHGALGNWAAENAEVATAITNSVMAVMGSQAAILAISGTILEKVALNKGVKVYSEIFADRGYTREGNLACISHHRS
jgi:UPF0271 protein